MEVVTSSEVVFFVGLSILFAGGMVRLSFVLLRQPSKGLVRLLLAGALMVGAMGVILYCMHGVSSLYVEQASDRLHVRASRKEVLTVLRRFEEMRVSLTEVPYDYRRSAMREHKGRIYRYDFIRRGYSVYVVYDDAWCVVTWMPTTI